MQIHNDTIKKNAIAIGLSIALLAVTGVSVALLQKQSKSHEVLENEVATLNSKVTAMANELGIAKTEAELAKREPEELKEKIANLKGDLAAFAKQAKSCERLKNKFKAK